MRTSWRTIYHAEASLAPMQMRTEVGNALLRQMPWNSPSLMHAISIWSSYCYMLRSCIKSQPRSLGSLLCQGCLHRTNPTQQRRILPTVGLQGGLRVQRGKVFRVWYGQSQNRQPILYCCGALYGLSPKAGATCFAKAACARSSSIEQTSRFARTMLQH